MVYRLIFTNLPADARDPLKPATPTLPHHGARNRLSNPPTLNRRIAPHDALQLAVLVAS
jgi:hypothetical protein